MEAACWYFLGIREVEWLRWKWRRGVDLPVLLVKLAENPSRNLFRVRKVEEAWQWRRRRDDVPVLLLDLRDDLISLLLESPTERGRERDPRDGRGNRDRNEAPLCPSPPAVAILINVERGRRSRALVGLREVD